jgi:hypothetical protein
MSEEDLCRQEEKLYLDEALELAEYSVKVLDKSETVEEYTSDESSRILFLMLIKVQQKKSGILLV